jgi:hypothetical protein
MLEKDLIRRNFWNLFEPGNMSEKKVEYSGQTIGGGPRKYFPRIVEFAKDGYYPAVQFVEMFFVPDFLVQRQDTNKPRLSGTDFFYINAKSEMLGFEKIGFFGDTKIGGWEIRECSLSAKKLLEKENFHPPLKTEEAWINATNKDTILQLLLCEREKNEQSYFHKTTMDIGVFKIIAKMANLYFLNPNK